MQRGQVYRSEEVGIAYDEWYSELPKDARLLWYTLKNSRDMTACGLVKVAMGTLCFETAMTRDEVLAAIEAISQPFKSNGGGDYSRVVYWPRYDTFWIHNFYRKQRANTNPANFDTSARKSLALFPEAVQACVLDTYPMLGNPILIPLPSHPYPVLDGSGIPSSISNKESVNSTISTEVEIERVAPAQDLSTKPKKGEPAPRKTSLPKGFGITGEMVIWARAHCPTVDIESATEEWLDYIRTRSIKSADWDAEWRKGMRNAVRFAAERAGKANGSKPESRFASAARTWDELNRLASSETDLPDTSLFLGPGPPSA